MYDDIEKDTTDKREKGEIDMKPKLIFLILTARSMTMINIFPIAQEMP